jgi:hypothetical protein
MKTLPDIARHWARQSASGKGIRLEAADLDRLNAIGIGEFIVKAAAEEQRKLAEQRLAERRNAGLS